MHQFYSIKRFLKRKLSLEIVTPEESRTWNNRRLDSLFARSL